MRNIDYTYLPRHMQQSMRHYLEEGIIPGDFLHLILCNDFVHAAGHADEINKSLLYNYAKFLYLEAPQIAWGSEEKVQAYASSILKERRKANARSS